MAAKKSPPAPTPAPTRATETSQTIKKETTITATRTDTDATHKGDPPKGTDAGVDDVLAGVHASRDDALNRAVGRSANAPDDGGASPKGGKGSVEQSTDGGQTTTTRLPAGGVVVTDNDEGVQSKGKAVKDDGSEITRIGNLIGSGGPSGPTPRWPSASDRRARLDRQVRVGRSGRSGHDHDAIGART